MEADENISDLINVGEFIKKWPQSVLYDYNLEDNTLTDGLNLSIPDDIMKELETVCSTETLKSEPSKLDSLLLMQKIPPGLDLVSVKHHREELLKREKDPVHKRFVLKQFKYKIQDSFMLMSKSKKSLPEELKVKLPNAVLTVQVHRPATVKPFKLVVDHTFRVLATQCLSELRDVIRCPNDLAIAGELSENPDLESVYCAKDIYKSGFFFIEDVFYNDMREEDARDYSQNIIDWAKKSNSVYSYKKDSMETTRFADLTLRLGRPYLYQHQGDCEHLIIFSDLRLIHPDDNQNIEEYPYMCQMSTARRTICSICQTITARWVTHNNMLAVHNPSFFCDTCFKALHYDSEGRKAAQFEAYRFFDTQAVL